MHSTLIRILVSAWPLLSSLAFADTLQLTVSDFESDLGELKIAVYNNKKDWLGENTIRTHSVMVAENLTEGSVRVELELEPGEYAISIFQDVNSNGELDVRSPIPIPKEPTGVSNNQKARFGPPKYKKARFLVPDIGNTLHIKLRN